MLGNKSGNTSAVIGNTSKITSSKDPLVARSELSESIGGTPKVMKKTMGNLSRRGNS
jgi:hypothetical protein